VAEVIEHSDSVLLKARAPAVTREAIERAASKELMAQSEWLRRAIVQNLCADGTELLNGGQQQASCHMKRRKPAITSRVSTRQKHGGRPNWMPGESGNPKGRPKGSHNKLAEAFLTAFYHDWIANGATAIAAMRCLDPSGYMRVAASLLPKELNVRDENRLSRMTDEEIDAALEFVTAEIASRTALAAGNGSEPTNGAADPSGSQGSDQLH